MAIHTMKEEHFGITIVEMMAAGLITIAHASGGPLQDIIGSSNDSIGFLASSEDEYTEHVIRAMKQFNNSMMTDLRKGARKHITDAFGVANFDNKFTQMTCKALFE